MPGGIVTVVAKDVLFDPDHDDQEYVIYQVAGRQAMRLLVHMAEAAGVDLYELPRQRKKGTRAKNKAEP